MKKILIVEDSFYMSKVLGDILSGKYKVVKAYSGIEAIKTFVNEKPDLVLLDIILPEGKDEGMRVLKEIKQLNPNAKVIMVSALGSDYTIEECKKYGVIDFFVKPYDTKKLIDLIAKVFAKWTL